MATERPAPVERLPAALCRDLQYLFTDIDDTLTSNGMLPDSSYAALWDLTRAGVKVVPVTGEARGLVRPHRQDVACPGGHRGERRVHLCL